MIELRDISLRYGPKVIFDNVGVVIGARDRIGLIGSNGTGKTTFLKALLGKTEIDGGQIQSAKYVSLGYLPQDGVSTLREGFSLHSDRQTTVQYRPFHLPGPEPGLIH